jgi:hypothetical protein
VARAEYGLDRQWLVVAVDDVDVVGMRLRAWVGNRDNVQRLNPEATVYVPQRWRDLSAHPPREVLCGRAPAQPAVSIEVTPPRTAAEVAVLMRAVRAAATQALASEDDAGLTYAPVRPCAPPVNSIHAFYLYVCVCLPLYLSVFVYACMHAFVCANVAGRKTGRGPAGRRWRR